jgi:small-conductance mechanosensitive channel
MSGNESFWDSNGDWISALITLAIAFAIAFIVDRFVIGRATRVATSLTDSTVSRATKTRLRLIRRLVFATIIVIGIAIALAQFDKLNKLATGILASSAVLGLVLGLAARQVLANPLAGILLAVSQPIRIGDLVTFEGETGEVEDVRLTYTYIRLDDGRRLVVPNERLAQSSVQNHTVVDPRVQVEVSAWLPLGADADRALELMTEEDVSAKVAEVDKDGIRLSATTWAATPAERGKLAADLRRRILRRLREEGLSSEVAS